MSSIDGCANLTHFRPSCRLTLLAARNDMCIELVPLHSAKIDSSAIDADHSTNGIKANVESWFGRIVLIQTDAKEEDINIRQEKRDHYNDL